jgi:hypothetical protein
MATGASLLVIAIDANGDGVGNSEGLMRRLDYLHSPGIGTACSLPGSVRHYPSVLSGPENMKDQSENGSSRTVSDHHLTARFRWLGLLPLIFFLAHGLYYVRHGGLGYLLWMCNIGNLVLAIGLFLGRPVIIRLAVFWLIPGLPLWIWYMVLRGGWLLTSTFTHVGGLVVGLFALSKIRADRRAWLYAFAWYLLAQQISRLTTPAELNVNAAHRIYTGWENVFNAYWQFWLLSTLMVGVGLWVMGLMLLKLWPPHTANL